MQKRGLHRISDTPPKSGTSLPPAGIDDIVAINPAFSYVDAATGTMTVSLGAIAFHELAEAFGKIDLGMQRTPRDGTPGAHVFARQWEAILIGQRPYFTQYPAGGNVALKKRH